LNLLTSRKKAENERLEKEMQEKLEAQRQMLEREMGIVMGPVTPEAAPADGRRKGTKGRLKQTDSSGRMATRSRGRSTDVGKRKGKSKKAVSCDQVGQGHDDTLTGEMDQQNGRLTAPSQEEMSIDTDDISAEVNEELEVFFNE
jgi:hypothetical protein